MSSEDDRKEKRLMIAISLLSGTIFDTNEYDPMEFQKTRRERLIRSALELAEMLIDQNETIEVNYLSAKAVQASSGLRHSLFKRKLEVRSFDLASGFFAIAIKLPRPPSDTRAGTIVPSVLTKLCSGAKSYVVANHQLKQGGLRDGNFVQIVVMSDGELIPSFPNHLKALLLASGYDAGEKLLIFTIASYQGECTLRAKDLAAAIGMSYGWTTKRLRILAEKKIIEYGYFTDHTLTRRFCSRLVRTDVY